MSAHGFSAEVVARDAKGIAAKWIGRCKCRDAWAEATYEAAEDGWRRHVYEITGTAPKPLGDKEERWTP